MQAAPSPAFVKDLRVKIDALRDLHGRALCSGISDCQHLIWAAIPGTFSISASYSPATQSYCFPVETTRSSDDLLLLVSFLCNFPEILIAYDSAVPKKIRL